MSLVFDLLGYRKRWRLLELFRAVYVSGTAPVLIGGCGSSGTTLVRRMLNRHPDISCGPESTVFLERITGPAELGARMGFELSEIEAWQRGSRSQAEFIDFFQAACLARTGKRIWADKTPENIRRLNFLWQHFPEARFVHVIRDGRDVACSLRRQPWMKLRERDSLAALVRCGEYWVDRVAIRRSVKADPRYIELRYEELVREPEKALRPVLEFLGLDWSGRLLSPDAEARVDPTAGPAFTSSIGRWRKDLSAVEIDALRPVVGGMLAELGYDTSSGAHAGSAITAASPPPSGVPGRTRAQPAGGWIEKLKIETEAAWKSVCDPRVPWYARVISPLCALAYTIAPIDPIPNSLPLIGHLDDLTVGALCAVLLVGLTPAALRRQHRSTVTARRRALASAQ